MNSLVNDPESAEHRLVELALHECRGGGVEGVAVLAEAQQPVENRADRLPFAFAGVEHRTRLTKVTVYPLLLFLQEFLADGPVVVGAHACAPFVFQVADAALLSVCLFGAVGHEGLRAVEDDVAYPGLLPWGDLHAAPPVRHEPFDHLDHHIRLFALSALPAEAVEVGVFPAAPSGRVHDAES
ncbi:hypothetical protein ND748_17375 [Frankia sp. AiPs1]|uniref:hypothetical protein n=1 Tax=Frankia sp. AiPs1 TaxID=573493 RepID=UPI0020438372|nr:hypothetical protein [Frankia sp. AiPs1]MCM3923425.1 hypothetical protein [Frankia sp. AiPs1]